MVFNPLRSLVSKSFLGIDVGSASLKVVEISGSSSNGKRLENYGQLKTEYFLGRVSDAVSYSKEVFLSKEMIINALKAVLQEAKIKKRSAFFAIPDYATFFTTFQLPSMSRQELEEAVKYEAPRHIPMPLADVTLDWEIVKGAPQFEGRTPLKVLLVAVPNETINQYQEIAKSAGLEIAALESEAFSLARALIKYQDRRATICLIDLGERSATINIVSQSVLRVSHSIDVAGTEIVRTLSEKLNIDIRKAKIIKKTYGIQKEETIRNIIFPLINSIAKETKNILNNYFLEEKEKVEKIILAGGNSLMPGLRDYFIEEFRVPIEIGNPFIDIFYPPGLELILKKIGPEFTIAVGAALRGVHK